MPGVPGSAVNRIMGMAPGSVGCLGAFFITWGAGRRPFSHGFAVPAPFRQGGRGDGERIATASVRTGFAMTGFPWSVVHGRRATARVAPTEGYKECLAGGRTGASAPTGGVLMVPCAAGHIWAPPYRTFL